MATRIIVAYRGSVHSKTIAVLGLTFKGERESVLRDLGWYAAASGRRGLVRPLNDRPSRCVIALLSHTAASHR
jgi:hypothetical protein